MMKLSTVQTVILSIGLLMSAPGYSKNINVQESGVKADGVTMQTTQIQRAIDECARTGGGVVTFSPGKYLTGTLYLRSHVELYLERGAAILGSTNIPEDYPVRALIYAKDVEDAGISGHGIINGQADTPEYLAHGFKVNDGVRPNGIIFEDCKNMTAHDFEIRNAASWTFRLLRCDGVRINAIRIHSLMQGNNDGIDVDARNVTISNCLIECDDDGICLKSDSRDFLPENITVSNCVIASNCNPIKFGTSSYAGFRNVTITNCAIRPTTESHIWDWSTEYDGVAPKTKTGLAGIAIECVDGGKVEHITISNITMEGIITPIFICMNKRHGDGTGVLRDVSISQVTAVAEGIIPSMITGIPGSRISDILLRDITVEHYGGEKPMAKRLPENLTGYPENRMFGRKNPAGGLYVRHADNIKVENFKLIMRNRDERPIIVADDVDGLKLDEIKAVNASSTIVQNDNSKNVTLDSKVVE
ncbi:MAG: glycoside hydrolase family 28 protein [Prevotella sp.]|jgi:polygalacturonase